MYVGERLYAEKPKQSVRRMECYWKAGRAKARSEHDRHPTEPANVTRTPPAVF